MAYISAQIASILNDVIEDLTGESASIQTISTTDLVSMGKAISSMNLLEGWYGKLVNRLAKTVYFIRVYDPKRARSILRDEHEYGAFVQKVYFEAPAIVDNPEYKIPSYTGGGAIDEYTQHSPYDVKAVVAVDAKIFGGQGTFALEIVRPVDQIRTAFLNDTEMMRFIDGIYLAIENKMKFAEEALVSTAITTAMAADIKGGQVRNLLTEYNTLHEDETGFTALTAELALTDSDFLKFASKEINQQIKYMKDYSEAYNVNNYPTFTDPENMVVEVLSEFAAATASFLEADTYHKELVELPRYEEVNKWQFTGQTGVGFANMSSIKVQHDDFIVAVTNPDGIIAETGIIAFVHDIEHVAAYFGHRRSWEVYNARDDVYVHGETARKGYAVDLNANAMVFIVKDEEP
jgi:hypothetical protein